jgi:histidinol-phosphate aminotransferase
MLPFLRSDLAQLVAYTPHPGGVGEANQVESAPCQVIDRLDTNENPFDLPDDLKQKLAWVYQQTIESNRYPDGEHWELKQAIADYLMQNVSKDNRKDNSGLSLIAADCHLCGH